MTKVTFTIILVFIIGSTALSQKQEYIRSKDEIVFHSPDMLKFSNAGKISAFRGVIERIYFKSPDLKLIDLYQFNTDDIKVTNENCMQFIEKIFAIKTSKLFKLKYLKIENSNKGHVCEAYITDKNLVTAAPFLRYITIGFVNANANVLVYHPKTITDEKISETKKFWTSLR